VSVHLAFIGRQYYRMVLARVTWCFDHVVSLGIKKAPLEHSRKKQIYSAVTRENAPRKSIMTSLTGGWCPLIHRRPSAICRSHAIFDSSPSSSCAHDRSIQYAGLMRCEWRHFHVRSVQGRRGKITAALGALYCCHWICAAQIRTRG
jgi:hypothetical protein